MTVTRIVNRNRDWERDRLQGQLTGRGTETVERGRIRDRDS